MGKPTIRLSEELISRLKRGEAEPMSKRRAIEIARSDDNHGPGQPGHFEEQDHANE